MLNHKELLTLAARVRSRSQMLILADPDEGNFEHETLAVAEGVISLLVEVTKVSDKLAEEILSTSGLLRDQKELAQQDEPPRADSSGWPYDH